MPSLNLLPVCLNRANHPCLMRRLTWVAKDKRRRDIDNLFASMKAYIDGLVAARLIEDDSAMNVTYTLKYEQGGKNNTVIEVKEIG